MSELQYFVAESLRIEGIKRKPTQAELAATQMFLDLPALTIDDVVALVGVYQPNARLRDVPGLNVRVGSHIAPSGGDNVRDSLVHLLTLLPAGDPYEVHQLYEHLHPFTDGNGRSGRALWAWQMVRRQGGLPLGFLHQFYYQALAARQ